MSFINHNMHPFDWETLIEEVQPILAEEECATTLFEKCRPTDIATFVCNMALHFDYDEFSIDYTDRLGDYYVTILNDWHESMVSVHTDSNPSPEHTSPKSCYRLFDPFYCDTWDNLVSETVHVLSAIDSALERFHKPLTINL